ncbi:MAG: hypothetical protein EPO11_06130 [Gammaproteobacteria bacterium]|nr:MAG: hypothetical protein EPO11_06130 [Gammaproteobacteria bacterium]
MKKIVVFGPVLPQWSDIQFIANTLQFLRPHYEIDFIDPLESLTTWQKKMGLLLDQYDVFLGFSLGGVILQQSFSQFENRDKSLILFSVPSFIDTLLQERLSTVIDLAEKKQVNEAIHCLNRYVSYPNQPSLQEEYLLNETLASLRLSQGLRFVLETDSRSILQNTPLPHLHFIGEKSQLVNKNNVISPKTGQLMIVPHAGMRVLQDNLSYCMPLMTHYLEGKQ